MALIYAGPVYEAWPVRHLRGQPSLLESPY
jgi:hypothetical protein